MSLGEVSQISAGIYAYLQPDGSWYRAYLELDGAERRAPVDLAHALDDMLAYNGGRPLTCRA